MIAFVFGVMAASTAATETLNVFGSMSTKTGVAPALWMVPAVAKKVNGVVITSSPRPMSRALSASSSASVPLAHPIACFACESFATSASSRSTGSPRMKVCASMTLVTAASISSRIVACCARRSSRGTDMCGVSGSDPGPAPGRDAKAGLGGRAL